MSQSSILVGLLAAAFLLYVAAKGRLPTYTAVLWGKKDDGSGTLGPSSLGITGSDVETAAKIGANFLAAG